MKKWLIGSFIILVLLFLAGVYLFIPQNILVSKTIISNNNEFGAFRFINNHTNWQNWWPGKISNNKQDFSPEFKGYNYRLGDIQYNAFRILIEKDQHIDSSVLYLLTVGSDSIKITWDASLNTGSNPFTKISRYFNARKLGNNLDEILIALKTYIENKKNIYGFDIKKEKVKVEYLVSTTKVFPAYPETEAIYEMIGNIKKYISQSKAKEDDYPMLNIKVLDSGNFEAQLAIPVDKQLPSTDRFSSKRMLRNGDILVTEVRGGKIVCDSAMKTIALFAADHRFTSVALPFQSLITDRTKEKDTSNWVTKIYYPVVY